MQSLTGNPALDSSFCIEQPASATAHPQLSTLLKSSETTNPLVGGGIGTFTNLIDYKKASLVNDAAMLQLANGQVSAVNDTVSPNSTSCTSGLADLSWASNESAAVSK